MKIDTITKKIVLQILGIAILVLLSFRLVFPNVFYQIMEPYFKEQIAGVMSDAALRQSYIWRNNAELHQIANDKYLEQLITAYYNEEVEKELILPQILEYVPVLNNGTSIEEISDKSEKGYIVFDNYLLLCTDRGDIFYSDESDCAANIFQSSDWYQNFDWSQEVRKHLPVIGTEENRFFCVVESFWAGEIHCLAVNMVTVEDVLLQLSGLKKFDIQDFLIYCNGEVLYRNLDENCAILLEEYPDYLFEGKQYEALMMEHGNESTFVVLCTYVDEGVRLVANVPKILLLEPYRAVFDSVELFVCGVALLLLVAFGISLQGTLRRLKRLEKKMNFVRNGDYEISVSDEGCDEISNLTNTFGMMLDKIRIDKEKEEQMQYMLMVSAIDPHYVYNTLNTVTALAELGRDQEIVAVNTALIGTLKDRVKMKNYKTFDTVKAEQQTLEQYMLIQSYLCYTKIDYTFEVSPEDQNLVIPKNIIQPLVENAIKHGILCREEDDDDIRHGRIDVSVVRQNAYVCITVSDNGAGMSDETLVRYFSEGIESPDFKDEDMCHIGIKNLKMRLNYLYRGDYEMTVESRRNSGTSIRVLLPIALSDSSKFSHPDHTIVE